MHGVCALMACVRACVHGVYLSCVRVFVRWGIHVCMHALAHLAELFHLRTSLRACAHVCEHSRGRLKLPYANTIPFRNVRQSMVLRVWYYFRASSNCARR